MKRLSLGFIAACLLLPIVANAAAEDYRFPREPGTTKDGYPLPLTGVPITKTPVIGTPSKKYPEHYIPGKETLAEDEMRITACGTWGPAPMRIGQGASCILAQLGNGESFIFDIGGGTVRTFILIILAAFLHFSMRWAGRAIPLCMCGDLQVLRQNWVLPP